MKVLKQGSRVAGRNNEQVEVQETLEPIIAAAQEAKDNDKPEKKPKKKRTWKFKAGITIAITALAMTAGLALYNFGGLGAGLKQIEKGYKNIKAFFDHRDEIVAFAEEALPIDNNGIIEVTYPITDRTLEEENGRYSFPEGYVSYMINGDEDNTYLEEYKGNSGTNKSVVDYQTNNGLKPVGSIGIYPEYKNFLDNVAKIKENIAKGDTTYTVALNKEEYEVKDIYSLPDGYDLYTEDEEAKGQAKIVYIAEDKTKVYMIPAEYVDKFIGLKSEICIVFEKYEGLREQIIFAYNTYNDNSREYLGAIDEETRNHSR